MVVGDADGGAYYLEGAHDHIILEHKGDGNKDKV